MRKDGNRKDGGKAIFVFCKQGDVPMTFNTSSIMHFKFFVCIYGETKDQIKQVCIQYQSKILMKEK